MNEMRKLITTTILIISAFALAAVANAQAASKEELVNQLNTESKTAAKAAERAADFARDATLPKDTVRLKPGVRYDGLLPAEPTLNLPLGGCTLVRVLNSDGSLAGWTWMPMTQAAAFHAKAQDAPEYVWAIATIQPDETVEVELFDKDSGALVRHSQNEPKWFDVTDRRRTSLNELRTGKWNQDFTVNALRYWTYNCSNGQQGRAFNYTIEQDWSDGKRLVALMRRFYADDDTVQRAFDAAKKKPSEWVAAPAWVNKRRGER